MQVIEKGRWKRLVGWKFEGMRKRMWSMKESEEGRMLQQQVWAATDKVLIIGPVAAEDVRWLALHVQTVAVMNPDREATKKLGIALGNDQLNHQVLVVNAQPDATPWLDHSFHQVLVMPQIAADASENVWKECRRITQPNGVLTVMQKVVSERMQDLTASLFFTGFEHLRTHAHPSWHAPELLVYQGERLGGE